MPKRSSKSPDENVTAYQILNALTDKPTPKLTEKNPAAVALGRLGGKKGGPARAKSLSAQKRKEIAKKAAKARWKPR